MQDLAKLFSMQFEQAREVEMFFRNRYRPRTVYEECMQKGDTHLAQVNCVFISPLCLLLLSQPVETRWGSQFDCLQSILANRKPIELAVGELRRQEFDFHGNEIMFIWNLQWWAMVQKIVAAYHPLRQLIASVEAKGINLGSALACVLECLPKVQQNLKSLAPG